MIRNTRARQVAQSITGLVFVAVAVRAAFAPEQHARDLGYALTAPNGYSELFAVYVGVWTATALLALIAIRRPAEPTYGDLLAMFVLAQPLGRLLAIPFWGVPAGVLFWVFMLEAAGAAILLIVRPDGSRANVA